MFNYICLNKKKERNEKTNKHILDEGTTNCITIDLNTNRNYDIKRKYSKNYSEREDNLNKNVRCNKSSISRKHGLNIQAYILIKIKRMEKNVPCKN